MSRFRLIFVIFTLCSMLLVTPGALARQGAGCEGAEDYVAALNETGNPVTNPDASNFPEGSMEGWTDEQLGDAIDEIERIAGELEEIDPPAAAEEFHGTLIEAMDMLSDLLGTVRESGIDAGMAFADQFADIDTRLYDQGLVLEESCQIAVLDHDFDGEPEIGTGDDPSAVPTVGAESTIVTEDGQGSRTQPVPMGTAAMLDDEWQLTILSVTPDATADVLADDPSNTPPADGLTYFIARVQITYLGTSEGNFSDWRLSLEDSTGLTYAPFIDYCGYIPDELSSDVLFPGESFEGNVCWAIPSAEAAAVAGLAVFDGDQFPEDRIYFSLDASTAGAAETSGAGGLDSVSGTAEDAFSGWGTPEANNAERSQ